MHGCIDTEIADWDRERYISRRYYWPEWQKKIPELFGEERAKMGVNDLLDCYAEKKKKAFDNDRMMLA